MSATVISVCRSGREYVPAHAIQLHKSLRSQGQLNDHAHYCLTDTPLAFDAEARKVVRPLPLVHGWDSWWAKLELFRPDLLELGDLFFLDLDTVILGDCRPHADARCTVLLEDFYQRDRLGSGLMYLPVTEREIVWQQWTSSPEAHRRAHRGDQEFLMAATTWLDTAERWQRLLPGTVCSFKVHLGRGARPAPAECAILCFHGRPRPWQAKW